MSEGKFVAYYRVSTARQGQSGLGLEAQQKAVMDYLNGGDWELVGDFTEVETGKGSKALSKRPQLVDAIMLCRKHKAKLVIAKLDRLARNVHFISGLMETRVDFVAVDMPSADPFMLHVYAAMAEEETRRISQRTKDALAAAKARGVVLGQNGQALADQNKADADGFARSVAPAVHKIREKGAVSVRQIAAELNRQDIPTARGGNWHVPTTHRLLKRIEALAA
jgi:DNA invertase Pin-like site-specific DNA recombinase